MLMNYGFLIDRNPYSTIELHINELKQAFYTIFRNRGSLNYSILIKHFVWKIIFCDNFKSLTEYLD